MLSVAAQDVRLTLNVEHAEVKIEKILSSYASNVHPSHREASVRIPDMLAEEKKDLILTLILPPDLPIGTHSLFNASLTYIDPNSKEKGERMSVVPVVCEVNVAEGEVPADGVNLRLDKEKNRVLVAEAMRFVCVYVCMCVCVCFLVDFTIFDYFCVYVRVVFILSNSKEYFSFLIFSSERQWPWESRASWKRRGKR